MSSIPSRCVQYTSYGDPTKVLKLASVRVNTELATSEVLVKWLASPVNPLDINLVEGSYARKPSLPAIGGAEATGIVEKVGWGVRNFSPGDRVVPLNLLGGLWTEFAVIDQENLIKVDPRVDLVSAATLLINPPTAYLMLKEYVKMEPGEYVIQNAANSGVGRCVIQLAKAFGYRTINLVRNRANVDSLKTELRELGADYVFTEDEFHKDARKIIAGLNAPLRLALNGVGGRSALLISAALNYGGTLITYGGMSKKPSEISTGSFVFKNLKACGISVGQWTLLEENRPTVEKMFKDLQARPADIIIAGKLRPIPVERQPLGNFAEAIRRTVEGCHPKQLLLIHNGLDSKL
ncbi:Protein Y48A6B.9 a [Aphelenchoides avenae]|nr:Protein Y48A6B.9 a [Aphelenchus avenae]